MPKTYLKPWLESEDLPALKSESGDNVTKATCKRSQVVGWLNLEIKKAHIEVQRQMPPHRFYMLKKFATSIRTSMFKQQCRWWLERESVDPEDIYCEYVARRDERANDKVTR